MGENFKPHVFGRYYLTELIARGGMAELYRAKLFGAGGFEKTLAVKRVLPQFVDDLQFVTMLTDEARLTVQLSHPNIVQVFDFGRIDDSYYIAMELLTGVDTKTLLNRMQERGEKIPQSVASWILAETCRGLQYAHSLKDGSGTKLNIVHRDVSPQNILLSFNGEVKVTDFGIAKAASNVTQTQTGMIKGKIAYMSPEQAEGLELDGRTDIFAAGLMLYEMLTGKLLFDGDSQFEILGKIRATHINLEMLPSSIPLPLRQMMAKALAHDRDARYATAGEFQKELGKYLAEAHPDMDAERFADYIRTTFADKVEERERHLETPVDPQIKAELATAASSANLGNVATDLMMETEVAGTEKMTTTGAVLKSARHISIPLFLVSFVLFFFADFFKPLLWLSPILMLLSAGTALTLYFSSIKKYLSANPLTRVIRSRVGEAFVFAMLSVVVWGIATVISAFTPPQGLLAANIPPVGTLQEQLFQLKSELSGLKSDLARLEKTAAINPSPKTAQDFYHNARQYQVQGNTRESITAYGEFLKREPNIVDAHQAYQTLLQTAGGAKKTKAAYAELTAQFSDNVIVAAMAARLLPEAERIAALDALIQKSDNPFLIYERLKVYLDRGLGLLTTNEWIKAKSLYDDFIKREGQKVLKTHFLDGEALEKTTQGLTTFDVMYVQFGSLRTKTPIKINHEQYENGVSFTIWPQESKLKKILYTVDSPKNFLETGSDPNVKDPFTDEPSLNYHVVLQVPPGKHTLYAKYIDSNSVESAMQEYPFELLSFFVGIDPLPIDPSKPTRGISVTLRPSKGFSFKGFEYSIDKETFENKVSGTTTTLTGIPKGNHTLFVRGITADGKITATFKMPLYL